MHVLKILTQEKYIKYILYVTLQKKVVFIKLIAIIDCLICEVKKIFRWKGLLFWNYNYQISI